jgi:hypothetical protein
MMTANIDPVLFSMPDEVKAFFRLTGSQGGRKRAALYSRAQLREWGKLGGRPRKDGSRPGQAAKKGGR